VKNRIEHIAVIGMGYVGIPAAVLLAAAGYNVTGIQRRSERSGWKIDWLNEARCPISGNEPLLPELLKSVVQGGKFRVTDDYSILKDADAVLIDVQTPTNENHVPQYDSLKEACHNIGRFLRPGELVIIESTVAPGTTEYLIKPILEEESGLAAGLPDGFGLCFSYERVMVGRLIHNIREYPKIVGGIDNPSTWAGINLYRSIVKAGVRGTDPLTAEVSKTVENAYRDVQIAFANEVALLCEALGIDVYDVRKFVNELPDDPSEPHANPVRNMHFPGAGVGGHCLPKDTWLLLHGYHEHGNNVHPREQNQKPDLPSAKTGTKDDSQSLNPTRSKTYPFSLLEDARYLNDWMPTHTVDLLEQALTESQRELKGATIGVLGYAFLENSDDPRNTPTLPLIKEIERRGAKCKIHDPYIKEDNGYKIEPNLGSAMENCDAIVLMTKHTAYRSISPGLLKELLRTRIIIDGRNLFNPEEFIAAGFIFKGIGKGNLNQV
jgi:UDP-N-acetyl-D-mannosaminuronic acid dehydrogenase